MDRAEDLVGRSLGRYRITALVGKGGMATVYKATHPGLGQTVAVKVLHPHMATDPDMLGRFQHEAQAVANLRHPNIVRVLDFDVQNDQYFMVMEYVDGPTLAAQLAGFAAQGRSMPAAEVARLTEPLCSAVDYAHGQGMIHRDIKPSNVLLTPQGEPVLTDYGIAKMVGVTQHTATGTVMGSAYYMSPEQAQGSAIDGRTDIYSLGVMVFEMLTGRVPYEGDTLATVLVKHITAPVPAVRSFNADLPSLLDDVMDVALAKDPAQRFQTGKALSAAMRQAVGAAPAGETRLDRGRATPVPAPVTTGAEPLAARTAQRDVYISYAARDRETAEAVCARLEAQGISCWIAPRDVLPGRSFAQSLASAIHAARVFVLVFSAAANGSQQIERELDMAVQSDLPVIPVRVEAVRPQESIEYYLAGQHWVDAYPPPLDAHLTRLAEGIALLLETPARPSPASVSTAYEPPPADTAAGAAPAGAAAAGGAAASGAAAAAQSGTAPVAATTIEPTPAAATTVEPTPAAATTVEPTPVAAWEAAAVAGATTVEPAPGPLAAPPEPPGAVSEAEPGDHAAEAPSVEAVEPLAPVPEVPPEVGAEAPAAEEQPPEAVEEALEGAEEAPPEGEEETPVGRVADDTTEAPPTTAELLEPGPVSPPVETGPSAAVVGEMAAAAAVPVTTTPEPSAPTRVEPLAPAVPGPTGAATTVEPAVPAATTIEPPAPGATTVEPPAGATAYEPPVAAASAAAGEPFAAPQTPVMVPPQPAGVREAAGVPATFRTRALAAAALVGVAWIVLLFVLEKYVL